MKSYAGTTRDTGHRAPFRGVWLVVSVVALLGCSPGAAIHRVEASASTVEAGDDAPHAAEPYAGPPAVSETGEAETPSDAESDVEDEAPPLASTPRELLEWIVHGDFTQRRHVATGRFLSDFERLSPIVDNMDRDRLRAVSWGAHSSRLRAPVRNALDRSPAGTAELRIVKSEGGWKLENVTVNSTPRVVRDGNGS